MFRPSSIYVATGPISIIKRRLIYPKKNEWSKLYFCWPRNRQWCHRSGMLNISVFGIFFSNWRTVQLLFTKGLITGQQLIVSAHSASVHANTQLHLKSCIQERIPLGKLFYNNIGPTWRHYNIISGKPMIPSKFAFAHRAYNDAGKDTGGFVLISLFVWMALRENLREVIKSPPPTSNAHTTARISSLSQFLSAVSLA